jgi:long-chain acyl-CoA synthetase
VTGKELSGNAGALIRPGRDPAKVAIVDLGAESAPREVSFSDLDAHADAVARALQRRGIPRGERIAILSANRAEYVACVFGIMRAGLVAVPVNFKFPRETIEFIVSDCAARLVFCDRERHADCPPSIPAIAFGPEFERFCAPGEFVPVSCEGDEPALFLYTSGSTGRPKGVVLTHGGQLWTVATRAEAEDLSPQRILVAAPLYHMNALALAQVASATHASLVLLPQFTAAAYLEAIARFRPTFLTGVPPMMAMFLRERDLVARTDFSSVAFVRMGSAPVSASLVEQLRALLPKARITNAYGTTEAGPVVFGPHPRGIATPQNALGCPHPKIALRLVDAAGREADEGVLEMRCPALMLGYHNRPDLKPFTADGYYVTGDVFRRDEEGFHYFIGRADDMFVSGGENIYPGDVERMLERHPDVAQACVVPIDDEVKGQKPVAFIVAKDGRAPGEGAIREFALAHAPAYQHPRFVFFLDRLPLASTNKIDRAALAVLARERLER